MIIKKDVDLTLIWTCLLFRLVKTLTSCFPKKEKNSFISKTFTGTRAAKNPLKPLRANFSAYLDKEMLGGAGGR